MKKFILKKKSDRPVPAGSDHPADQHADKSQDLELVKKQAQEYLAGWQRAKADYNNLAKRTEESQARLAKTAAADLVRDLLPVIDNLERALESASQESAKSILQSGLELVLKQLHEVLKKHGVSRISAKGQPFDPSQHEAIAKEEGSEGVCVSEHAAGYKIGQTVLRPCRVSVGTQKITK